jgi:superfamily II DNA or RNA helicase
MSILRPRDYQVEAIDAVIEAVERGTTRPVVLLPVGSGKTVTFAHLINKMNVSTVVLVHRDELAEQAADKIRGIAPDLDVGIVKAERNELDAQVKICSIQTLYQQNRIEQLIESGPIGLIVYDECHHAPAPANRSGLGDVWQEVVFQRSFLWGVANGFLVDVRAKVVTIDDLDLSQIAKSRGDYRDGQLGDAMIRAGAPAIAAREFKEAAGDRQGIGFTPTVRCAEEFVKEFRKIGITTELIVGTTPKAERERIYQEYRDHKVQMLMSVMALTEGFDMPQAEICGLFRPTENTSLYQQMVGRVSRPFPGKDEALILDLVGATKRNHLASLSDLSETQVTLKPEESLREAYERELKEEKNLESDVLTGNTTSKVISLFKSSPNVWIQTPGGRWFIPTREGYVFLWPKDGKFQVGITGSRYKMKGGRFLQELPLSLDLAMAWGEQLASEIDETVSEKDRAWRKRKAEKSQRDLADSLGIVYSEGVRKGELSDMISLHFATEIFD